MHRLIMLVTWVVLIGGCEVSVDDSHGSAAQFYPFENDTEGDLPFSDAVRVGNLLFLSGRIGNFPGTLDLAPGGIQGETRQAMENIKAAIEKYGAAMDQVVKCTVFLADIGEWGEMNEIYKQYFPTNKPTRSALGANGLALGARVEIECIAAVN